MEKFIGWVAMAAVVAYGEWTGWMTVLLSMVVVDLITGWAVAFKEKSLKSKISFLGLAKKCFIFLMVLVAHKLDVALGDAHMFRDATIFFYIANELLSLIENCGRLGLPVPSVMKQAVDVLKKKGEM